MKQKLFFSPSPIARRPPIRPFSSQTPPPKCPTPITTTTTPLRDLIRSSLHICPASLRRLWRAPSLLPGDILTLLLSFDPKHHIPRPKIESLWSIFLWAQKGKVGHFQHLPSSCEAMILLLLKAGMLQEATFLLGQMESRGVVGEVGGKIYGLFISGYLEICDVGKAASFYDQARIRGFVPGILWCEALLGALIEEEDWESFVRVYVDLVGLGVVGFDKNVFFEVAVRHLVRERRVLDAADLLRSMVDSGKEVDPAAFDRISDAYRLKRDFDDLRRFLRQWNRAPSAGICNKIVFSMCENCGVDEAVAFVSSLEELGFVPDAGTFGVLIGWRCREGNLRGAFMCLSDLFSRNLKPDVCCYNAIMCGLFKEGMWERVKDVFLDMIDCGVEPDASTFRVLLAGYCNKRQFDEARLTLEDMKRRGLVALAPFEDPISKVFAMLGLEHLGVKIKRCKDIGFQKAEFLDSLGNGLYLDGDVDECDRLLALILNDAMVPDLSLCVMNECQKGNVDVAIKLKEEINSHGQDVSLHANAALVKGLTLSSSPSDISKVIDLLEEMPNLVDRLDNEVLSQLACNLCKAGFLLKARLFLEKIVRRGLVLDIETYSILLSGFADQKNQHRFKMCWEFGHKNGLVFEPKKFKFYTSYLCNFGMLKEALELFDCMLHMHPSSGSVFLNSILCELCVTGYTNNAYSLWKDATQKDLNTEPKTYERLIMGLYHVKMLKEVKEVLDFMFRGNAIPTMSTCQAIFPVFLRSKEIEKVMNLKQTLLNNDQKNSHLLHKVLISAMCSTGYVKEARLELFEMGKKGLQPETSTFNKMLVGYMEENNLTDAKEVLCFMLKMNIALCMTSYKRLVRLHCLQGRLCSALSLKNLLKVGCKSQLITLYNFIIFSLFQTGHGSFVESVLNEIRDKSLVLDNISYDFLIHGYSKCGNISKSVETLFSMIEGNFKPSTRSFRIVISYLCNQFDVIRALELSNAMERWGVKHGLGIQSALVGCLISQGKLDDAEALLARLEQKELVPGNISYDNIIRNLCMHRRVDKAIALLNMMQERRNLPSEISYNSILDILILQKDYDHALDFLVEMHCMNLPPSKQICVVLIQALCGCRRSDDARMVLELSLQSGQKLPDNIIYSIIDGYVAEKDSRKASDFMLKMQQNGHLPDFKTHWSLISNLNHSNDNYGGTEKTFLSRLLSQSGFTSLVQKMKS